jgi:hypothetical protein
MCTGTATPDDATMDTRQDIKPFFPSIASQRGATGFSICQAAPTPLGRGARIAAPQQPDCVLNRAASEVPGDVRSYGAAEDAATKFRQAAPVSTARISSKFWSAGDYEAAGAKPAQPPRSTFDRHTQITLSSNSLFFYEFSWLNLRDSYPRSEFVL